MNRFVAGSCHGETFDTVVVGATSGGAGAAIAVGSHGLRVTLMEDSPGGMISNGVFKHRRRVRRPALETLRRKHEPHSTRHP